MQFCFTHQSSRGKNGLFHFYFIFFSIQFSISDFYVRARVVLLVKHRIELALFEFSSKLDYKGSKSFKLPCSYSSWVLQSCADSLRGEQTPGQEFCLTL